MTAGARKRRAGIPSEDAVRAVRLPSGAVILAVADGAGSAAHAADAANLAAGIAVGVGSDGLNGRKRRSIDEWVEWGNDYVAEVIRRYSAAVHVVEPDPGRVRAEWKTTLTVTIAAAAAIVMVSVGDGFVVGRSRDGSLHLLMPPDRPHENANETRFLSTRGEDDAIDVAVVDDRAGDLDGIVLASDGLLDFAIGRRGARPVDPHPQWFPYILERVGTTEGPAQVLQALVGAPQILASTGDDLSVVAAVR